MTPEQLAKVPRLQPRKIDFPECECCTEHENTIATQAAEIERLKAELAEARTARLPRVHFVTEGY